MQKKKSLDELPALISEGKLTQDEAARVIFETTYTNPGRFNLLSYTEDQRSDFLLFCWPKFKSLLKSFKSTESTFGAYVYNSIQYYKLIWAKQNMLEDSKYTAFKPALCSMYREQQEKIQEFAEPAPVYSARKTTPNERRLVFKRVFYGECRLAPRKSLNKKEKIALILALKSAWYVDDDHIRSISSACNLNPTVISDIIEEMKGNLVHKSDKRKNAIEKMQRAYYFFMLYRTQMKNLGRNSSLYEKLSRVSKHHEKIWRKTKAELDTHHLSVTPSITDIGKMLGINPNVVSYYLSKLKAKKSPSTKQK